MPRSTRSSWSRRLATVLVAAVPSVLLAALPASAAETHVLSGTVRYVDGSLASGASMSVYVFKPELGFWDNLYDEDGDSVQARADSSGHYAIELPTDTYRLVFAGPYDAQMGYSPGPRWWPDASSSRTASDVVLDADRADIDMVLPRDGKISGRVTVESTGAAIPSAKVSVLDASGDVVEEVFATSLGRWVTTVPAGDYTLHFSPPRNEDFGRLASEWYRNRPTRESADDVTVGDHASVVANAALGSGGSIRGRLTAPRGVDGAVFTVTAQQADGDGWETIDTSTSTSEGAFELAPLGPGTYRVCYSQDLSTERESRTAPWGPWASGCAGGRNVAAADDVDVRSGEPTDLGDVPVAGSARIEGRVTDVDGIPVPGVRVCPFTGTFRVGDCLARVGYATTDDNGDYTAFVGRQTSVKIAYVPSRLSPFAPRFTGDAADAGSASTLSVALGRTYGGNDAVLRDDGRTAYSAVVRNRDGRAQSGVYVSVSRSQVRLGEVRTDASGRFEVSLAPGVYTLRFYKPGFLEREVGVRVTDADTTGPDVRLQSEGTVAFTGRVLRAGVPLRDTAVRVTSRAGGWTTTLTDEQGRFAFRPQDETPHRIDVRDGGGVVASYLDADTGEVAWFPVDFGTTTNVGRLDLPGPALASTAAPSIVGDVVVGRRVTVDPGAWNVPDVRLAYQWLIDGTPVPGATSSYFTPARADRGKELSVRVTASRQTWHPAAAVSAGAVVRPAALSTATPQWLLDATG